MVIGGIVGGVLGGLLIIGGVIVAIVALYFRNKKAKHASEPKHETSLPGNSGEAEGVYQPKPELSADNTIHEADEGA